MNYHLETHDAVRLASVKNGNTNVFYAKLSADFHEKNSPKLQAISLVYQQALLAGAGTLDKDAFLDALNSIGASIYVNVSQNTATFTLKSRAEQTKKLLALFTLIIEAPQFSPKEITRIRKKVMHELHEQKEEARYIAHINLVSALFTDTDRRHHAALAELESHVGKVTKDDLKQLHRTVCEVFWQASAGTDTQAISLFSVTLQKLRKGSQVRTLVPDHAPKLKPKAQLVENIPSKQNIEYSIGASLPLTIHHPDYIPFVFGLAVLGKWGGFTGRLMSTVREKEGLTYGIYARTETVMGAETGYWRIMTFFNPKDATQGLNSTMREIRKIVSDGITMDEHTRFKTILTTQQQLLTDSYTRSIDDLHGYILNGLTLEEMATIKARLATVTKAEIDKALREYIQPDQIVVSAAGPVKKSKN